MTRCVLDWLDAAAQRAANALAVDAPDSALTWAQMRAQARRIGCAIARRVAPQMPVLIVMEKSPACVAAMLGAVCAGCFYTPLDVAMPPNRMRLIYDTLQPALVVCEEKHLALAQSLAAGAQVLLLSQAPQAEDAALLERRREQMIDTDLLYVLFTSGSTGVPKGVAIAHRSVVDFVSWACETLRLPEGLRFGSQAPFYFDNSVLDIYCAMRRAGSLYLIPQRDFMFPRRLLATLAQQRIDTVFWVPSALTLAAETVDRGMLPDLRRVFFCGEIMPCRTLNLWRAAVPEADYVNMYGPTEITDVCAWYRVDRDFADGDSLPIGFPCANTRITLIDGEICVGGTCLSPGYYNAPEKTAEVFTQNPYRPQIHERIYHTGDLGRYNDRGELMFLGRRDDQIKRNGYRIELGEIECALNAAAGVTLGCCYFDAGAGRIVGAYVGDAEEKALKAALKAALPKYMLPDVLLRRESLPRTGSGKVDRRALRQEVEHEHSVR